MNLRLLISRAIHSKPIEQVAEICGNEYQPYYNLMYLLAKQIDKGLLVELGVESGRGLASLASAKNDNVVIGLDTNKHPALDIVLAQYSNIFYLKFPSMPVCDLITRFERPISLLHIDTEHSYAMAKAEFEAYKPYLAKGAYVLFDDLHAQEDDVLRYFNELPYRQKIQDDRLHPICGYGVMIYE
jgi:cephalosporin hydroxylase